MKKLSLLSLVIALTTSSFAEINNKEITTVTKITTVETVKSLKIYNNVEVVLTDNELNEIEIVGEKTDVENILVKSNNGEISISSAQGDFPKDRVVIYVPAKNLAEVFIHGSATIRSKVVLSNELLEVTINGEGKSGIKTAGNIKVYTIADFPIESAL